MTTAVRLSVHTDVRRVRASLDAFARDQVPFATAKAINATMLEVQAAARAGLAQHFTLRRRPFAERLVKIERGGFATKQKPVGVVGIQGPRADVLAKFEPGGTKRPRDLGRIAVPRVGGIAKPRPTSIVREELRPGALLDNTLLSLRAFVRPFKSDPKTRGIFVVDRRHEARLGARRRGGRGASAAQQKRARPQLVYTLKPSVPIPATLGFVPLTRRVVSERLVPNLQTAVRAALATPKAAR